MVLAAAAGGIAVVAVALGSAYIDHGRLATASNKGNQASASRIITALEKYRAEHQRFPEDLVALAPGYMAGVPRQRRVDPARPGRPFYYATNRDQTRFGLAYDHRIAMLLFPSDLIDEFESRTGTWAVKDSDEKFDALEK